MRISHLFFIVAFALPLGIVGCVTQPAKSVEALKPVPAFHKDLAEAVDFIAKNLRAQVSSDSILAAKVIPVDLFFNEHSAEEAVASKNLQKNLIDALAKSAPDGKFAILDSKNIQNAQWVAVANYASAKSTETGRDGQWIKLKVAFADVKTGAMVAQVTTHVAASQFNSAPTSFYKNAPLYLKDVTHADRNAVLEGKGKSLSNSLRIRAALLEATDAYEVENWSVAQAGFQRVLELAPEHTGALSGLYQVFWVTGHAAEAEAAFARLAAAGVDVGSLSVKLLFKLGSTDFVDDADLGKQYQLWLRAMGQTVSQRKVCLDIQGHASASGSVDFNQKLSLARATRVASRMQQLGALSKGTVVPYGKGVSEMLVGTGANDATDSIDRRVEFVVRACQ